MIAEQPVESADGVSITRVGHVGDVVGAHDVGGETADASENAGVFADATGVLAHGDADSGAGVPFYGSTASGEVRELCSEWRPYEEFIGAPGPNCLPARLAAAGYETSAVHGFTKNFYERNEWFPNIGFEHLLFAEDLYRPNDKQCGPVFRGLCDSDLATRVQNMLKTAGESPKFVYWLTLNTHLPVNKDEAPGVLGCENDGGRFGDRSVCDLTEMFLDVIERVTTFATDKDMPKMDVLIVGDHAPPYWKRHRRAKFVTGEVTWISLRDRS